MPSDRINQQVDKLLSANSPATLMAARSVLRFNKVPAWLVYLVVILIVASFVPIALAVRARFVKSDLPRVHLIQGMDNQPRYNAQSTSALFANDMAQRPAIPGTVARGQLAADDFFERGYRIVGTGADARAEFFDGFPDQVELDPEFLAKGKELYARYCYNCHGYDGYGNGPIHVRAIANIAKNGAWVQPSSLHDETRLDRSTGHLYNTINVGIRNMAGYGHSIPHPADRWAIVAYVKALQLSQNPDEDMQAVMVEGVDVGRVPVRPTMIGGNAFVAPTTDEPADDVEAELDADPEGAD
jgi:mono/diheme cytochrome c family protein